MPARMDALAEEALLLDADYSPARTRAHLLVAALPPDAEYSLALPRDR